MSSTVGRIQENPAQITWRWLWGQCCGKCTHNLDLLLPTTLLSINSFHTHLKHIGKCCITQKFKNSKKQIYWVWELACLSMSLNIIQIHNNVLWDWQSSVEYSPYLVWMWRIFHRILSVPHNIVMDLNNVVQGNMGDVGLMKANHKSFRGICRIHL